MFECEYLGGAVHVVRVVLFTGGQRDMSDRLHWVGQGEEHLALLAGEQSNKTSGKRCNTEARGTGGGGA